LTKSETRWDWPACCHSAAGAYSYWPQLRLDSLPHNGAVVTLLAVCGVTHRESYFDIFMVAIVGALVALAAVVLIGSAFGSF
jgi:H+/gluconate symporter-like permease